MSQLTLSLFGPVKCTLADDLIISFAYDKVQALLFYLVVQSERPQRREMLAGLLWPDNEERDARHSLNQALWSLRQTIGERDVTVPVLRSSRETIHFKSEADCFIDVLEFEALFSRADRHAHRNPQTCADCRGWLTEAVKLYRGPFLQQFSLADCPEFEEWMLIKREQFHQMALDALERLASFCEHRGDNQQAIVYLQRLLELDDWREDYHRRLMRLLARTGQRPAALAHFDRLQHMLKTELDADVEPETRALRDAIQQATSENGTESINSPDRPSPSFHLPTQVNPLVGRKHELSDLADLIASGEHRFVTLIGPGGIGKTRLALQVASDGSETFSNGACFVPLAGVESSHGLVQAIADARSLTFYGKRDPVDQLLDDLHNQDLLLVLDNFEHLLDGAGLLVDILHRAPHVQIMVTSRERLNLYGEHVFPVKALDVPSPDEELDKIERSGAVQLFMRSARRANAGFSVRASDFPSIIRACELVSGMPLGIELAAAWAPILTCQEIAQEIERSIDFLTTSLRNVPERHRSMRAAFDHSWQLLTEQERDVFVRLSTFRGGFQKEAAERVAGATLSSLLALASKSFLSRNASGRFEIHELLRQYGAEKLDQMPEEKETTYDAHSLYYAEYLFLGEQRLKGNEQRIALEELIHEGENIRSSWNWALTQRRAEILQTLVHVWLFYEMTGRYQELVGLLTESIEVLRQRDDDRDQIALGRALSRRATSLLRIGAYEDSEATLQHSNDIMLRHDEFAEVGLNLHFLAMRAHIDGDYRNEERLLEESLRMTRLAGDQWVTAYSLNDLGMVASMLGDHDRAQQLIRESLGIMVAIDDWRGRAFALNNLGTAVNRLGRFAEALRIHQESLEIRRRIDNRWGVAQSLAQIGAIARSMGNYAESAIRLRGALRIASDLRAFPLVLDVLAELAELFVLQEMEERAFTIMAQIAGHPSGGPSIRARAYRLHPALDATCPTVQPPDVDYSVSMTDLDEVIALALEVEPEGFNTYRHKPIVEQPENSVR